MYQKPCPSEYMHVILLEYYSKRHVPNEELRFTHTHAHTHTPNIVAEITCHGIWRQGRLAGRDLRHKQDTNLGGEQHISTNDSPQTRLRGQSFMKIAGYSMVC